MAFNGFAAELTPAQLAALNGRPYVAFIEPDARVSLESTLVVTEAEPLSGEIPTGVNRIDAERGEDVSRINVAVVDTGIDLKHPDLNVKSGKACWRNSRKKSEDLHGHGTHVAGIIGAKDDGVGVRGVAPNATLWAVRALNSRGEGLISTIACGINWAIKTRYDSDPSNDIAVVNLSLSSRGWDDQSCGRHSRSALHRAICAAVDRGIVVVVAAGNQHASAQNFAPAAFDDVLAVSAMSDFNGKGGGAAIATCRDEVDDHFASFSNYGPDIDLAAPGVCIYSTYKGSRYRILSGTSMAAPHVTGLVALYLAQTGICNDRACVERVRAELVSKAKSQSDRSCGFSGDPDSYPEPLAYLGYVEIEFDEEESERACR